MIGIALLLAAAPDTLADHAWVRFSRHGALSHRGELVEVVTNGRTGPQLQYKVRLTRTRLDKAEAVQWADSRHVRRCARC